MTPVICSVVGRHSEIAAFISPGLTFPPIESGVRMPRPSCMLVSTFCEGSFTRRRPVRFGSQDGGAGLRLTRASVHTSTMTLKNAALLALIGAILMTALLVWNFVLAFLNVLRDLVPAVTLFASFIYAFGCFSVMVFFYVFHRAQ